MQCSDDAAAAAELVGMQSHSSPTSAYFTISGGGSRSHSRISDLTELEQSTALHQLEDAVHLSNNVFRSKSNSLVVDTSSPLQFGGLNTNLSSSEITSSTTRVDADQYTFQDGIVSITMSLPNSHFEHWGESGMVDASPQTDTSTDVDTDEKNPTFVSGQHGALAAFDSLDRSNNKTGDQKTLRRLAQNREAARKSRLRKKAYVQQLESSRLKLAQLEQELQRARQQGIFIATGCSGDQNHLVGGNGAMVFDMEYARWLDEHQRHIDDLRAAVNSHMGDTELRLLVDAVMSQYDELFRLKSVAAKSDVFHLLSGMWKTPAERCFMWLGGFRSSELLKLLVGQLEPLTDQQVVGICNLQQSSQQAEDALSQGMEALQQSLAETVSSGSLAPSGSGDVTSYMGQMAIAMGKLGTLENFIRQVSHMNS